MGMGFDRLRRAALLAACLPLAGPAAAGERGDGACAADVERLCADISPGRGAIHHCLREKREELSGACRLQMAEGRERRHERREALREACADEAERLCADVAPGGRRLLRCLVDHEADLSGSCREQLPEHPAG